MNRILLIIIWIFVLVCPTWAENVYVSDTRKITVRKSPGNDKRVVSVLTSGEPVNVIQAGDEWTKIQLSDGKEGWVISRFLSTQAPCTIALKELEKKYNEMLAHPGMAQEEIVRLKDENLKLSADRQSTGKQLQSITENYDTLKKDSSDVVKLRASYDDALKRLTEQNKKLEQLQAEVGKITFQQNFKWFLAGGGVFLAGFILGFTIKRKRSYNLIR
jgi:SH3 domain protein